MAVIVAESNTTLSTVGGFYAAEEYRLGFAGSILSLSSTRTITLSAVLNNCNLRGVVLGMTGGIGYSVTVNLKRGGSTIATATMTNDQMFNISSGANQFRYYVPFKFATPVAVLTSDSLSLEVSSSGSGTQPSLTTADGNVNNVTRVLWGDTIASYSSGDVVVCGSGDMGVVTVDQTSAFTGILTTGDTTRSVCGIACRSTDPTAGNGCGLVWDTSVTSTLTLKGFFMISHHGGVQFGSESDPVTLANPGKVRIENASVGTAANTGFSYLGGTGAPTTTAMGGKFLVYANVPDYKTRLSENALSGTPTVKVLGDYSTKWSAGDVIYVGRRLQTTSTKTTYTISSLSHSSGVTTITLTGNLVADYAGPEHSQSGDDNGGLVINESLGWGFELENGTSTAYASLLFMLPSDCTFHGCLFDKGGIMCRSGDGTTADNDANTSQFLIEHCRLIPQAAGNGLLNTGLAGKHYKGIKIDNCYLDTGRGMSGFSHNGYQDLYFTNNIKVHTLNRDTSSNAVATNVCYLEGNEFDNVWSFQFSSNGGSLKSNMFWYGGSSGNFSFIFNGASNLSNTSTCWTSGGDNMFLFQGLCSDLLLKNFKFYSPGSATFRFSDSALIFRVTFDNPTGSPVISDSNRSTWADNGSFILRRYNGNEHDIRIYKTEGTIFTTGYGLADTYCLKSNNTWGTADVGEYSLKFTPDKPAYPLSLDDNYGSTTIGDNQNKECQVLSRVKINNANFYAGTHLKPTLSLTYDGATDETAVATATTDGQAIQISYTPQTTNSSVSIRLSLYTDATGTDRDVYVGKLVSKNGNGVVIDTQRLDQFDRYGIPLGTTRTFPAPDSVWDEIASSHNGSGTTGEKQNKLDLIELSALSNL